VLAQQPNDNYRGAQKHKTKYTTTKKSRNDNKNKSGQVTNGVTNINIAKLLVKAGKTRKERE
jgi:hypothetical protein